LKKNTFMMHKIRLVPFKIVVVLCGLFLLLGLVSLHFLWPLMILFPVAALGLWDLRQPDHSLLRNYPIWGHLRYLIEAFGPELRQYIVEHNREGMPFNRDFRSLVYQRSKNIEAKKPFGTELDVYGPGYIWVSHSMSPAEVAKEQPRVTIGGSQCSQPYSASVFNISAMSYGSLSGNAILALNKGAKAGGFYHTTGEGGISRYHRKYGGDLTWQIGSGYFGCRREDATFSPELFAEQACDEQVKMIEIKLSQGAKPGHGGILPAAKITQEIADTRKIPMGQDCNSPAYHSAFSNPIELLEFVAILRELSGGKPVGFKFCVGHPWEFLAICKAMIKTGIHPDFIVVDGGEGGTGAAPLEFSDRVGFPLVEGLIFVHNALIGVGLRDQIRIGASGKVAAAGLIAGTIALGADWANAARSFMFCLGCIQAQQCHTNHCPVGVATSDQSLQQALVVEEKAQRVANYHRNNLKMLNEITAAAGLDHPSQMKPWHIYTRRGGSTIQTFADIYPNLAAGELLGSIKHPVYARFWPMAQAESFAPQS
jgi:glutamate synthase domain-containing protein 2